jgi:hypothetical protein
MHALEPHVRPHAARVGQLARHARDAAGAQVLEADRPALRARAGEHRLIRDDEHALEERIGQLDRAALVLLGVEHARGERGAAETRRVGRLAHEHEREVAAARRHARAHEPALVDDADGDDVHEHVRVVAVVEVEIAAEVRHPERVAVVGDAGNHAVEDRARGEAPAAPARAHAQRVEHAHDVGAHAVHVAHDAAHARRRALVGHDLARVVVTLVREHGEPGSPCVLAEAHGSRVLAGTEHDLRRLRRQPPQQMTRRLVRAMLAPHRVHDHELGPARRAAEPFDQEAQLVRVEADARGREPAGQRRARVVAREVFAPVGGVRQGHDHPPSPSGASACAARAYSSSSERR